MNDIDPDLFRRLCVLTKSRRAARAVSRHFSKLTIPEGVTASQASTLFALYGAKAQSISALAEGMGIERSALTRNLALLEDAGLVEWQAAGRGGAKAYRLSPAGEAKLRAMVPHWYAAQDALRSKLGQKQWDEMQRALTTLAEL